MNGAEFIARTLISGEIFGVEIGTSLTEATSALGEDCAEDLHGRGSSQLLRRDYGLIEATFTGGPGWTCTWMVLELHRLGGQPELVVESLEEYGVEFTPFTSWMEVSEKLDSAPIEEGLKDGYRCLRFSGGRAFVVADASAERDYYPGDGDLWKVSVP